MEIIENVYSYIIAILGSLFFWLGIMGIFISILESIRLRHYGEPAGTDSSLTRVAIITGASGGLGRGYMQALATQAGSFDIDEFWLIARSEGKLKALATETGVSARIFPADLTESSSLAAISEELGRGKYRVSLLINCAGMGLSGRTEDLGDEGEQRMISLNDAASVQMFHLCLPYMGAGSRIANVASIAGFQSMAGFNTYAASKVFILNYSRALRKELLPKKISVTAVCPYWVKDTGFIETASGHRSSPFLSAKTGSVVKRSLRTIRRRGAISLPSIVSFLDFVLGRLFPDTILSRLASLLRV